jgi:hypothetical protein
VRRKIHRQSGATTKATLGPPQPQQCHHHHYQNHFFGAAAAAAAVDNQVGVALLLAEATPTYVFDTLSLSLSLSLFTSQREE